jgi:hypothetical protein
MGDAANRSRKFPAILLRIQQHSWLRIRSATGLPAKMLLIVL